jgi:hypothetical protein
MESWDLYGSASDAVAGDNQSARATTCSRFAKNFRHP